MDPFVPDEVSVLQKNSLNGSFNDTIWEEGYNMSANASVNVSNLDAKTLLERNLGERHLALWALILLNILYVLIFVSGIFGNACTCIVIARNRYMHTATNYYLFSLAVSDVLILIFAFPPEIHMIWEAYPWVFGEWYCITKSFIQEMTSYASVLTIAAFTIERYLAICHPMTQQIVSTPSRATKLIILQWVIACGCALPFPFHTRTFYTVTDPSSGKPLKESLICNIPKEHAQTMTYWFQVSTFVFFVYPMTVISVLYVLIGFRLQRSDLVADRNNYATAKARKAVVKMLVAVVVAFFVCWAPFHAQRLMVIYVQDWTESLMQMQTVLFHISGVLFLLSSTVNPILYNVMSRKYRRAFMKTIFPCVIDRGRMVTSASAYNSNASGFKPSSPYIYNKLFTRQATTTSSVNGNDTVDSPM